MYLKVDLFLVINAIALGFNPAIAIVRTALNSLINAIAQADSTATRDITGYTEAQKAHKADLLLHFKIVRAGLMGYYTGNLDPAKKLIIDHTDTAIDEFRNAEIYIKTDQLLDIAIPVKALLVPFGVTEAQVDALETLNNAWPAIEPSNRMEQALNKASGEEVDRLMLQTETLLDKTLDSYLKIVQYNDPVLHSQYLTARMIDDSGGGSGSDGYNVETLTIPAGGSIILPVSNGPIEPLTDIYLRAVNQKVFVCTTDLPASPCVVGYELIAGQTFKGAIQGMGLDLMKQNLQLTNPGPDDAKVRAGKKS